MILEEDETRLVLDLAVQSPKAKVIHNPLVLERDLEHDTV